MKNAQRLLNLTLMVSSNLEIEIDEIKRREQWEVAKIFFLNKITSMMFQLQYFGFTKSEINRFILGTEATLNYALFFFVLRESLKIVNDIDELKTRITKEWNSNNVFDNLDEMAELIIDDFFEKKGGVVFR